MGVSNKNAQDNIQPKGNKKDFKKPLQVLHISKKDIPKKSQEIQNEQPNSQEEIKKENIEIKPQITKDEYVKEIEDIYTTVHVKRMRATWEERLEYKKIKNLMVISLDQLKIQLVPLTKIILSLH